MEIIRANEAHVDDVAALFDQYRQFYDCEADFALAHDFIDNRIGNQESVIFLAAEGGRGIGFVQLYPSFCSVDAVKIFILYDPYVSTDSRKGGVGEALMMRARDHALGEGAARLDLLTAKSNLPGQHLYEKLGYKKVLEDFHAYSLDLG